MRIYFLTTLLTVTACTDAKAPIDDDFSPLAGMDTKSDTFSYRMKIAGSLTYGQAQTVAYTKTPRYRAMKFAGNAGDQVDAWVRSTDGDAVAWLLDNSFHVIASNDDADDTTLDAHLAVTLPASASVTHYIVFRDYQLASSHFAISLAGVAATTCHVDADCGATAVADGAVAECNGGTQTCESVAIADIHCGGFIMNAHQCPAGFACHLGPPNPDVPGHCVAN